MHSLWADVLPRQVFAGPPPREFETAYVGELADLVEQHAGKLAAVIVEPVVQGAGGMRFHDPRYLHVLRELCLTHDVLLVFDEIATGFGRTGELFACEHAGISPDVMCVGKALTGGYLTQAAALCTSEVARGISDGEAGVLMHGPTFMGNPLASAVSLASIAELHRRDWRGEVSGIADGLRRGLAPARSLPGVVDVRVLGAIGVVQLGREVDVAAATAAATAHGVWLRPFRDLVYTMPPYVIGADDLAVVCGGVCAAVGAAI
jgi:adenosylmethionine-8-amino-7-oxononanoate aminotransferase